MPPERWRPNANANCGGPHILWLAQARAYSPHIRSLYDGTYLATDVYVPVERSDDEGHQIGHVGLSVTAGGAERTGTAGGGTARPTARRSVPTRPRSRRWQRSTLPADQPPRGRLARLRGRQNVAAPRLSSPTRQDTAARHGRAAVARRAGLSQPVSPADSVFRRGVRSSHAVEAMSATRLTQMLTRTPSRRLARSIRRASTHRRPKA